MRAGTPTLNVEQEALRVESYALKDWSIGVMDICLLFGSSGKGWVLTS